MRLLKSIYKTFFYAPNVSKQPLTFREMYFDHLENPREERDMNEVNEQIKSYEDSAKETIPKAAENLVEKVILIGGGSLLLMANIMLSDKFKLAHAFYLFKIGYGTIAVSIVLAIVSFLLDITHASLVLSVSEASKEIPKLIKEYVEKMKPTEDAGEKDTIRREYQQLLEASYQDFRSFTMTGLRVLQTKNFMLLLATLAFLVGFSFFLVFGWINIEPFRVAFAPAPSSAPPHPSPGTPSPSMSPGSAAFPAR